MWGTTQNGRAQPWNPATKTPPPHAPQPRHPFPASPTRHPTPKDDAETDTGADYVDSCTHPFTPLTAPDENASMNALSTTLTSFVHTGNGTCKEWNSPSKTSHHQTRHRGKPTVSPWADSSQAAADKPPESSSTAAPSKHAPKTPTTSNNSSVTSSSNKSPTSLDATPATSTPTTKANKLTLPLLGR